MTFEEWLIENGHMEEGDSLSCFSSTELDYFYELYNADGYE